MQPCIIESHGFNSIKYSEINWQHEKKGSLNIAIKILCLATGNYKN